MTTIDTIDSLDTLPLSQKMEIWQKLFASVMTDKDNLDGPARLRLSQTGQCQRRLHYIHSRETPSDPTNLTRRHKLAMGHALEVLAILAFKSYGWETRHTCVDDGGQITLEMQIPGLDDPVQGPPRRHLPPRELHRERMDPPGVQEHIRVPRRHVRGARHHKGRTLLHNADSHVRPTHVRMRHHRPRRPGRPAPGPRRPHHQRGPAPRPALR